MHCLNCPRLSVCRLLNHGTPHYFNTEENLDYVDPMPEISYCGVDEMSRGERNEFLARYETHKPQLFDNRHVLEA